MSSSLRQNRSPPPASCMWPLMAPRSQNQMAHSRKSCSSRVKNLETIAFKCTERRMLWLGLIWGRRSVQFHPRLSSRMCLFEGTAWRTSFQGRNLGKWGCLWRLFDSAYSLVAENWQFWLFVSFFKCSLLDQKRCFTSRQPTGIFCVLDQEVRFKNSVFPNLFHLELAMIGLLL